MRNIKSTLRFARNSALLFVAASGMSYLSSCSETDINPDNGGNNGDDNVLVEKLKVTAGTNPGLAKTYPNSHQVGTRGELKFNVPEMKTMPEMPSAEELAKMNLITEAVNWYNVPYFSDYNGKPEFYIQGDVAFGSNGLQSSPFNKCAKFYIDGNVSFDGTGPDTEMEIYILPGGSITDNKNILSKTTIYLYGGGTITRAGNDGVIDMGGTLIATGDLYQDKVDIEIGGKVYTTAKLHGKTVTLNGGEVYAGCAVTAKEKIYFTGNNSVMSTGYVSAPEIALSGNSPLKIVLRDGGYLHATDKLSLTNIGNVYVVAKDGNYAMVETDVLNVNNKDLTGTFDNIGIKYNSQEGTEETGADETYVNLKWNESTQVYWVNEPQEGGEAKKVVFDYALVDGDDCAPQMVVNPNDVPEVDPIPGTTPDPTPDPTPVPTLENIGSVAPTGDHTHPISATCIFTNGKDAYLSWHTQGANFHGCIEYLTVDNGTVTLNSYLETAPTNDTYGAVDFNHVIFDNGKIFVAGDHPKKGGILGWIHCNDGKFVIGEAELNIKELYNGEGGSGNCIIRNGNYYQVASVKGFETYNVNDFNIGATSNRAVARLAAYKFDSAGELATGRQTGKHIATDGQRVVMLTLINRDNTANTAKASIKVYNASDIDYKNVVASYVVEDAVLSPVDGKDVIAIEGDDIWVCLGKGGVQHLKLAGSNITKVASFSLADLTSDQLTKWSVTPKQVAASCANGLAVGNDGYVYVAHGGAGLVVLNKDDLSFVTRSRHNGGASANYVKLHEDGYIYVAYGKSNVQVFGWRVNQN